MERMHYKDFAQARQAHDLRLIDVREVDEFEQVHVKGAELFPLSWIRQGQLPTDDGRRVALICRSGARSAWAAQVLEQSGFVDVINVEGGTLAALELGPDHVDHVEQGA